MKTKFLIPVLAMIFAVGMSFTTVNANQSTISGYVERTPGNWVAVQVDCEMGANDCEVRFLPNLAHYQVYATQDYSTPLKSSSEDVIDL